MAVLDNRALARREIKFYMRQIGCEPFPAGAPMSPYLRSIIDGQTAQEIYEEIIADLERRLGRKLLRS